ncbi:MAG: hypothetical protein OEV42_12570 [Deltaproteobacteria bacterium]|nr:hypothetical protein [Deltaproteobacteria bacterium]
MSAGKSQNKSIKILSIITVNILITLVLILILEVIASFYVSRPGDSNASHYQLNHTWRPNTKSVHREWIANNPDFPEPYTHYYNSQGWLEKYDIKKENPASTFRIFYVGDSFTEGTAPMDQSVPSIVEEKINEMAKGKDINFEVINTGTGGYSPTIYYILTRYYIAAYSPDLVVINVDMTDDFDDWKYAKTLIRDNEGNPLYAVPRDIYDAAFIDMEEAAVKATPLRKTQLFLVQRSYIYNLIIEMKKKWRGKERLKQKPSLREAGGGNYYPRWSWCKTYWSGQTVENVNNTLDILKRLIHFGRENNIKILLTSVPHYWQYSGNYEGGGKPIWSSRPHRAIESLAKAGGVPYLNSFEKLKPYIRGTPPGKYYYNGDPHFNPRGYAILAQAHIDFLINAENRLLPDTFYDE